MYEGITGMLQSGYANGAWTGNGIRTSSATNTTQLGVAEASDARGITGLQTALFAGETVDATSVLVKYTYKGDATLDGRINIDDYGVIDTSNSTTQTPGYFRSDFNFDGRIDIDDYGLIDATLAAQGSPL
jgi:hypothetical protein